MSEDFMEYPSIRGKIIQIALNDSFWGIRMTAFGLVSDYTDLFEQQDILPPAMRITYDNEPIYHVRREALNILRNLEMEESILHEIVLNHMTEMMADTSYFVAADAIVSVGELFPEHAPELILPYVEMYSYQDVIRNAVAQAMILSGHPSSMEILIRLAEEPGERRFKSLAISHLSDNIRQMDESMLDSVTVLFGRLIHDPSQTYRMMAYEALGAAGATSYLEALKKILETGATDSRERRVLKDAIRILQYNKMIDKD
jgi:HEAT repeat protein